MQQRRLRPGDVLDDYCPRERRITDHAIVAMIDDEIKQTRCGSCDTEHEYKQARVPPQRRKKAPPALFTQVLDGLQGPARPAQSAPTAGPPEEDVDDNVDAPSVPTLVPPSPTEDARPVTAVPPAPAPESRDEAQAREADRTPDDNVVQEEGPVRRPLIRAQLPRHEGQQPPARELPDFTIRQPTNGRGANRPAGHGGRPGGAGARRRQGGHQGSSSSGQSRFGGDGHGRANQFGRSGDRRQGAGHGHGQGSGHGHGQGQGQGYGRGRPNRGGRRGGSGGKKH